MQKYHHGDLRAALLEHAIVTIGTTGVEGLSMRKLAKDLGVSHAAPKRHFDSKADLLTQIVTQAYDELTHAVISAVSLEASYSAVDHLSHMTRATMMWAQNNRSKFSVMMNPDVSRFAGEAVKKSLGDFKSVLLRAIEQAQEAGFMQGVPTQTLLLYLVGATLGVSTLMTDDLMSTVLGVDAMHMSEAITPLIVQGVR